MRRFWLAFTAACVLCVSFCGCQRQRGIAVPFTVECVDQIDVYRIGASVLTEKKVVTQQEEIRKIMDVFNGFGEQVEEYPAGKCVDSTIGTGFRFYLKDGRSYSFLVESGDDRNHKAKSERCISQRETARVERIWHSLSSQAIYVQRQELRCFLDGAYL